MTIEIIGSKLQRKLANDLTMFTYSFATDLFHISACQAPFVLKEVANAHGLGGCIDEFVQVTRSTLQETLQQKALRVHEFMDFNHEVIVARLKSLTAGTIAQYPEHGNGAFTQLNLNIIITVQKWVYEGNLKMLLALGFTHKHLDYIERLSVAELAVIAQTIDCSKTPIITFNERFTKEIVAFAYDKAKGKSLRDEIVMQGITQKHASHYLSIQKTALSEIREYLQCKVRGGDGNSKSHKPSGKLDAPAVSEVYRIYERDFGLYGNSDRIRLMLNIAREFNVTFSCIAECIEAREEFYSWLRQSNTSFDFAQSFYGAPERLRKYFNGGADRHLEEIYVQIDGAPLTVHHVLSQQTANERLRIHQIIEKTGLPISELYKFVYSKCSNVKEQKNVETVFKNAAKVASLK